MEKHVFFDKKNGVNRFRKKYFFQKNNGNLKNLKMLQRYVYAIKNVLTKFDESLTVTRAVQLLAVVRM